MRVEQHRPGRLPAGRADVAVVIDVFRMTSTAAVMVRRSSCDSVAVAATLADLDRAPLGEGEPVIVSELAEAQRYGLRIDNSPVQVASMSFEGRAPVLVTTNGTRMLFAASACAERVLLASFVDLFSVARFVTRAEPAVVWILPAGHYARGEARIEDDLCADALAALLRGEMPDVEAAHASIRADARVRQRVEGERGFADDLELALRCEQDSDVLQFSALDAGVGSVSVLRDPLDREGPRI